ncbi:MAG: glycosyltransferase family 4 protein [Chloroflexi bacterium]|nr:glycosyltransferase family 4 protein [Chloroflexota bacterium]
MSSGPEADGRPRPAPARPVCMIVHAYYDEDSRVRRQAESLVARGRPVDVYSLRRPGDPSTGTLAGVRIVRLDVQRHQGAGIVTYLREYLSFLVRAGWTATRAHRRRRYAVAEVHTLPDFLVAAALPLRLAGVPVILDLHEAMPDFFRMRFRRLANPASYRILLLAERISIGCASAVMTVNDALADRLVARGVRRDRITVLLNSPSLERFDPALHPARAFMADGTLRLVYAGALTPTYELDVVLEAVATLRRARPGLPVALKVYGRGDSAATLEVRAAELGLAERVAFPGRIPIEDVPAAIAGADIGLAPTRRDPFTDASLSTKIFEYGAMGKPVVASRLPMVERTFPSGGVATYEPGDAGDLARSILALVDDAAARDHAVATTLSRIRELSWEHSAEALEKLIERLASRAVPSAPSSPSAPLSSVP